MRKAECKWDQDKARALLASSDFVHLASTASDGTPVLRALNAVCVGDFVAFHGAKAGESKLCLGRPAIVSAERVLAKIPSYFVDPDRACPATTYYESVQAKGKLEVIEDADEKSVIIEALMQKYQAEGGYVPLDAKSPLYKKDLRGLQVYGLRVQEISGKFNLGQRRKGQALAKIVDRLWRRGDPGDLQAIDTIAEARPEERLERLVGPAGTQLRCQLGDAHADQVVELLRDSYWNLGIADEAMATAHRNSSAWVGCLSAEGKVVGSARAVADAAKFAWILDVIVSPSMRAHGLGHSIVELLLDHPKVRDCRSVGLVTRDAEEFYRRFGFEIVGRHRPSGNHQMLLQR